MSDLFFLPDLDGIVQIDGMDADHFQGHAAFWTVNGLSKAHFFGVQDDSGAVFGAKSR